MQGKIITFRLQNEWCFKILSLLIHSKLVCFAACINDSIRTMKQKKIEKENK